MLISELSGSQLILQWLRWRCPHVWMGLKDDDKFAISEFPSFKCFAQPFQYDMTSSSTTTFLVKSKILQCKWPSKDIF